jgi:probable rRNA maturation factor
MIINIDITIQTDDWLVILPNVEAEIYRITEQTLNFTNFTQVASAIELSIVLTNDNAILKLNQEYRNKAVATNVLSFPIQVIDPNNFNATIKHNDLVMLGDIVLSSETLVREAQSQGKNFYEHFCHLLVHGILHLLGYDHEHEQDAVLMESLEVDILKLFTIKSPYS